jgi:hypothetical protein
LVLIEVFYTREAIIALPGPFALQNPSWTGEVVVVVAVVVVVL